MCSLIEGVANRLAKEWLTDSPFQRLLSWELITACLPISVARPFPKQSHLEFYTEGVAKRWIKV